MSVILSLVYFTRICTEHYYVCLLLHNLYFHFICFIFMYKLHYDNFLINEHDDDDDDLN